MTSKEIRQKLEHASASESDKLKIEALLNLADVIEQASKPREQPQPAPQP